ncbi:L-rhamnose mutarotase [Sphingomonas sp. RHCKR7]|uniref:L-rhamnose mutarotase n=1 Tax=Sphingomonas folli TaxID=2862497 RepID=UPI001C66CA78|nr:L-rhamnose mutarotase [Sphingomonas folli]MBW6526483.1 L-rhamnose mutarotase [Sphingomonas folli]
MSEASPAPRRIVRVQDLVADDAVYAAYDKAHAPGHTPAAVLEVQRRHGIAELEIYRVADRLVMIMTVTADYDPDGLDRASATLPALIDWHRRMGALQRRPAGAAGDWPEARRVFRQSEHPAPRRESGRGGNPRPGI